MTKIKAKNRLKFVGLSLYRIQDMGVLYSAWIIVLIIHARIQEWGIKPC
jgi:hypothetical protein